MPTVSFGVSPGTQKIRIFGSFSFPQVKTYLIDPVQDEKNPPEGSTLTPAKKTEFLFSFGVGFPLETQDYDVFKLSISQISLALGYGNFKINRDVIDEQGNKKTGFDYARGVTFLFSIEGELLRISPF